MNHLGGCQTLTPVDFFQLRPIRKSSKFRCKETLKRALEHRMSSVIFFVILKSYVYSQSFYQPRNKPRPQINNWIPLTGYISPAEAPFADSAQKRLKNPMTITVSHKSRAARGGSMPPRMSATTMKACDNMRWRPSNNP